MATPALLPGTWRENAILPPDRGLWLRGRSVAPHFLVTGDDLQCTAELL